MNQPWDIADSQRSGSSTTFNAINSESAISSRWLVRLSISAAMVENPLVEPLPIFRKRLVIMRRMVCITR